MPLPLSAPIAEQSPYKTEQDAMSAAAQAALALSQAYEVGGGLYQGADGYHYTQPISAKDRGEIQYRLGIPKGAKLDATWHTHPGQLASDLKLDPEQPSDADLASVKSTGVPMYIVAVPQHALVHIGANGKVDPAAALAQALNAAPAAPAAPAPQPGPPAASLAQALAAGASASQQPKGNP